MLAILSTTTKSLQVLKENYNFFPTNRAISLDGIAAKTKTSEQETKVLEGLTSILSKLKEEVCIDNCIVCKVFLIEYFVE